MDKQCVGVLSGEEIKKYSLIDKINPNYLQASSYDLCLGDRHYLFEGNGRWKGILLGNGINIPQDNSNTNKALQLHRPENDPEILVLPPFGSAIVQINELIDTRHVAKEYNKLIIGRFDLKLSAIYMGLISQQATQVEPCYRGRLYCFLHNLSSQPISLPKGMKIATIEFSYAGESLADKVRKDIINTTIEKNDDKYSPVKNSFVEKDVNNIGTGIGDIRWFYEAGRLPKECGVAPIYRKVDDGLQDSVYKHLEKSETIEKLAGRVHKKLNERENLMRALIAFIITIVSFFGSAFVAEVRSELSFFKEQLAFLQANLQSKISETFGEETIKAISDHTDTLQNTQDHILLLTIAAIGTLILICVLLLHSTRKD